MIASQNQIFHSQLAALISELYAQTQYNITNLWKSANLWHNGQTPFSGTGWRLSFALNGRGSGIGNCITFLAILSFSSLYHHLINWIAKTRTWTPPVMKLVSRRDKKPWFLKDSKRSDQKCRMKDNSLAQKLFRLISHIHVFFCYCKHYCTIYS